MDLEIIEVLYIALTIFIVVVGSLLSIVLFKVSKALDTVLEFIEYYNKFKQILSLYSHIPEALKDSVKGFFSRKK